METIPLFSVLFQRVLEKFQEIDVETARLQIEFGLYCPHHCGLCCESTKVEASVLEMLPIAESLFARQLGAEILLKAQTSGRDSICVFFEKARLSHGLGGCSIYPLRPSICRLFCYSAVRDKNGRSIYAPCRPLKTDAKERVEMVQHGVDNGFKILSISEASQTVANLDLYLGTERLPINAALASALSRVGLALSLSGEEPSSLGTSEDSGGQGEPPLTRGRPHGPKRAA